MDQRVRQSNVNLCDVVKKSLNLRDFGAKEHVGKVQMISGKRDLDNSCESGMPSLMKSSALGLERPKGVYLIEVENGPDQAKLVIFNNIINSTQPILNRDRLLGVMESYISLLVMQDNKTQNKTLRRR